MRRQIVSCQCFSHKKARKTLFLENNRPQGAKMIMRNQDPRLPPSPGLRRTEPFVASAKKGKTQNYPRCCLTTAKRGGSALVLVVITLLVLAAMGVGLLTVAYGVRHDAIRFKNEATAMLAAEAGYEKAIYWMSQQLDMLSAFKDDMGNQGGHGKQRWAEFSGCCLGVSD